ncbi:SHOCT domain-containing protein [Roseovarius pelagicus]|uniref:SHOCT domain-containing protein n=1 Tax=Roseovarius pelagicus TaxID=2980108 RepID=A0ABY6DNC8_9RHOB|nr:SHOCT domain-containing protein [Roseovarius pelagicus]UXX85265.1 SHOCT domain-containing protein [Roseovarius pelagicus]
MKKFTLPVISFSAVSFATAALATPEGDGTAGYSHMMWNGGHGLWGGLMMVVFWGLIIGLIVLAARGYSARSDNVPRPGALDVLQERYARGEIDEDEYDRRKAKLQD